MKRRLYRPLRRSLLIILMVTIVPMVKIAYAGNINIYNKILNEIEKLEKKIEQTEKKQVQIAQKINQYRRQIVKNDRNSKQIDKDISVHQKRLSFQLRQLQRLQKQPLLKKIIDPKVYNQTKQRIYLIKQLPRLHVNTIALLNLLNEKNRKTKKRLNATFKNLKVEQQKFIKLERQLIATRKQRKKQIKQKKSLLKKAKIVAYSRQKSDQVLLKKLQDTGLKNLTHLKHFRHYKGKLDWPSRGIIHAMKSKKNYSWEIMNKQAMPVRAVAPGKVEYIGRLGILGKVIIINHGDNYRSIYKHLHAIQIKEGQTVQMQQIISESGKTGGREQYGISFELRHGRQSINFNQWLQSASL